MEDWIHRIMAARNPDWRSLAREPMTDAIEDSRRELRTTRRER